MKNKQFIVTKDHIKLIQRMYVGWAEWETGAPCVDGKRPYGNSYVAGDVAEILEWSVDEFSGLTTEQENEAMQLHRDTHHVAQILFSYLSVSPGTYELQNTYDHRSWIRID